MCEDCAAQYLCCHKTITLICLKTNRTALPTLLSLWANVGAGKGPWGWRGCSGSQGGYRSAAGRACPLSHLTPKGPSRVLSISQGKRGRACNGDGLIHQSLPTFIFWASKCGFKQGLGGPEVPSRPTACEPCRQALAWAVCPRCQEPGVLSPEVSLTIGCSSQKEQILPVLQSKFPCTSRQALAVPSLDVSYQSISR